MINKYLLDAINRQTSWAFVGSGVSVNAGLPTWADLLCQCYKLLVDKNNELSQDAKKNLEIYAEKKDYPKAFRVLSKEFGKDKLRISVTNILNIYTQPSSLHKIIARWPFQGYVTANYDTLLDKELMANYRGGWVTVGNTISENRKISGDIEKIIWHPHGLFDNRKCERIIIDSEDYDEFYAAGSPTEATLLSLIRMKILVFIGFGFQDPDLIHILEKVSRLSDISKPSFAFIANCNEDKCQSYLQKYNVIILTYNSTNNDHKELLYHFDLYSKMIISRDLKLGQQIVGKPQYDPEVTSLLIHNRIVEDENVLIGATDRLIKANIFKIITNNNLTLEEILNRLPQTLLKDKELVNRTILELIKLNIILIDNNTFKLSAEGKNQIDAGKNHAQLIKDQFVSSIRTRICQKYKLLENNNTTNAIVQYFEDMCQERGLGVAEQLSGTDVNTQKVRIVSLLDGIEKYLKICSDIFEANAFIGIIYDVFSQPEKIERIYLGLLTQAYFGSHKLLANPNSTNLRSELLSKTLFILDSSTLIPLLGCSGPGNIFARNLINKLRDIGAKIITTDLLVTETTEHAKWAWDRLDQFGSNSPEIMEIAMGLGDYRSNVFLTGYLEDLAFGPSVPFQMYFVSVQLSPRVKRSGFVVNPQNSIVIFDFGLSGGGVGFKIMGQQRLEVLC